MAKILLRCVRAASAVMAEVLVGRLDMGCPLKWFQRGHIGFAPVPQDGTMPLDIGENPTWRNFVIAEQTCAKLNSLVGIPS
jgi:hypothetical protein